MFSASLSSKFDTENKMEFLTVTGEFKCLNTAKNSSIGSMR